MNLQNQPSTSVCIFHPSFNCEAVLVFKKRMFLWESVCETSQHYVYDSLKLLLQLTTQETILRKQSL